jgi:DNA-binding FadR family transcriptional regulator
MYTGEVVVVGSVASPSEAARRQRDVSRLFSGHIGDLLSIPKLAELTARQLEEEFIADGWPTGKRYGSEAELARGRRVGYLTVREAARILQVRQTARVRRGRAGGLELMAPSLESVLQDVRQHFAHVARSREHAGAARAILGRLVASNRQQLAAAAAGSANAMVSFLFRCLDQIDHMERASDARRTSAYHPALRKSSHTLASKLAYRLVESSADGRWRPGLALGTELELCERYGVAPRVFRQAIRILESADMVSTVTGRAGGLVTRQPGQTSIARLLCCYFSANRFDHHETFKVHAWLAAEVTSLMAQRADAACVELVRTTITSMLRSKSGNLSLLDVSAVEDSIFALAGNPILELFLRSTKAFASWARYREPMPVLTQQDLRELLGGAVEVLTAVRAGDPTTAAAAQKRRLTAVARWKNPEYR